MKSGQMFYAFEMEEKILPYVAELSVLNVYSSPPITIIAIPNSPIRSKKSWSEKTYRKR